MKKLINRWFATPISDGAIVPDTPPTPEAVKLPLKGEEIHNSLKSLKEIESKEEETYYTFTKDETDAYELLADTYITRIARGQSHVQILSDLNVTHEAFDQLLDHIDIGEFNDRRKYAQHEHLVAAAYQIRHHGN